MADRAVRTARQRLLTFLTPTGTLREWSGRGEVTGHRHTMIFTETSLHGAYVIELKRLEDERGFFARAWCSEVLRSRGLDSSAAQLNVGFSRKAGTLRGLHFRNSLTPR